MALWDEECSSDGSAFAVSQSRFELLGSFQSHFDAAQRTVLPWWTVQMTAIVDRVGCWHLWLLVGILLVQQNRSLQHFGLPQQQLSSKNVMRTSMLQHQHRLNPLKATSQPARRDSTMDFLKFSVSPEVSLGAGLAGLFIVLFNRLFLADAQIDPLTSDPMALAASDIQSRSDILAVMACSGLLLNVLSEQDIVTKERDKVALAGYSIAAPWIASKGKVDTVHDADRDLDDRRNKLRWLLRSLLPANKSNETSINSNLITSVHIFDRNLQLVAVSGVVSIACAQQILRRNSPMDASLDPTSILRQALDENREIYLPDLQVSTYPGIL